MPVGWRDATLGGGGLAARGHGRPAVAKPATGAGAGRGSVRGGPRRDGVCHRMGDRAWNVAGGDGGCGADGGDRRLSRRTPVATVSACSTKSGWVAAGAAGDRDGVRPNTWYAPGTGTSSVGSPCIAGPPSV